MKKIKIGLYDAALFYLYLPIVLFVFGWLNTFISIPLIIISLLGIINVREDFINNKNVFIAKKDFFLFFIVAILFFVFCGHGELLPQDGDWNKHHAILYDLMNYDWPVVYDENAMLTYYIGQYIVPATIGKMLFHSTIVANLALMLWNSLGLTIVFIFLTYRFNANTFTHKLLLALFIIVWGGATNLGAFIYDWSKYGSFKWIDMSFIRVHFASNFDALRGAFQHVIVPWISCCLFLDDNRRVKRYLSIGLPLLFSSTFGFIYFAIIMLVLALSSLIHSEDKVLFIKNIFCIENMSFIPLLIVLTIYFAGNFFSDKPTQFGFNIINMLHGKNIKFYLCFIFSEFLLYALFLWKKNINNDLFYIVIFELLLIPFISMGEWNDLCSRGGIPARFILMLFCLEAILDKRYKYLYKLGIIILVVFSTLNDAFECIAILYHTYVGWNSKNYIQDNYKTYNGYAGNPNVRVDDAYNYFTLEYDKSIFYYISKDLNH